MSKIDAQELYKKIKYGERAYKEEVHCPMILDVMNNEGTMTAFCKKALISDALFYQWIHKNKMFKQCYELGRMLSKANWEEEGEKGKDDENFNFDAWKITGNMRYGVGKNKVRMGINPKSSPYKQYQELVSMANAEEFNASEIKQLMESINVGIRAYESFELQDQMNEMKDEVKRMQLHNANNSSAVESTQKAD